MPVNLVKGQKVELKAQDGAGLHRILVGLGWDQAHPMAGMPVAGAPAAVDCDASAILCQNGRLAAQEDIVFYAARSHSTGAVQHAGDNLTGAGEGDDEVIYVNLDDLPPQYDRIVFVANIFDAKARYQDFGMVRNAYIRITDANSGGEIARFSLGEDYAGMTAVVFGEVYRRDGAWKFSAIGQGTTDSGIPQLAARFR